MCFECFDRLDRVNLYGIEYFNWYEDETCLIGFSEVPKIANKQIHNKVMSKEEIKQAKKKPLYLENDVSVVLWDKRKEMFHFFRIDSGYDYDGASIWKFFWRLIGSKEDIRFKIASLIHDKICEEKILVAYDRRFSSIILERLLRVADTDVFRRFAMFVAVEIYQMCRNWNCERKKL